VLRDSLALLADLRRRGEQAKAEQANQELPDRVDPGQQRGIIEKIGIDPQDSWGACAGSARSSGSDGAGERVRWAARGSRA